jgi:hypothetical protein
MKNEHIIFDDLLKALHQSGVLFHVTLIGGWCLPIYRAYFDNAPEIPILRTMDLDILVHKNITLTDIIDVPKILNSFGFDEEFSHLNGYCKYVHPEIEVEFMVAESGKGKSGPYSIKSLNVMAQGLRFMSIVTENTITVSYKGIPVNVPDPAAFVLLKYLISTKRQDPAKETKDLQTANELGQFMFNDPTNRERIKIIFNSIYKKWQHTILRVIEEQSSPLFNYLQGYL